MKIELDLIESVLKDKKIPADKIAEIVTILEAAAEEEKAEKKTGEKKSKNQFIGICISDDAAIRKTVSEASLYLVTIKENESPDEVIEKARKSGYAYNSDSRAGRAKPARTLGAIFQQCKRKFFKQNNLTIKTQEPLHIVTAENKL